MGVPKGAGRTRSQAGCPRRATCATQGPQRIQARGARAMRVDPVRRLYWRLLRVPFVGRRLQRAVEFGKASVRRVAVSDVDALRDTLQLQASAIDGLWKRIEF